jgi:hypothetical protein
MEKQQTHKFFLRPSTFEMKRKKTTPPLCHKAQFTHFLPRWDINCEAAPSLMSQ